MLNDFHTSISIRGCPLCNQYFPDDIDLLGGSATELQDLTATLETTVGTYGMEISTENARSLLTAPGSNQYYAEKIKVRRSA